MKKDLNDRASSRDASGPLFDLIDGSQSGGKPDGRDQGFQETTRTTTWNLPGPSGTRD